MSNSADKFFGWLHACQQEPAPKSLHDEFGLYVFHTGGGCTCVQGQLGPVNFVNVTTDNMAHPTSLDESCIVAVARTEEQLYDGDAWNDGAIEWREFPSVTAACEWLRELKAER